MNRPTRGAADSPRWCANCQAWGDHHTDRCPTDEPEGFPKYCPECISEGACVICTREHAEDIADDIATERALDEWRGIA